MRTSKPHLLYITPGCFDKGGISRYNRYQIAAFRDLLGPSHVSVYSLAGHSPEDFEDPFSIRFAAGGLSASHKLQLLARTTFDVLRERPSIILAAHVNLSGVARALARIAGSVSVLNIYGREVWSGLRPDARWGLLGANHVVADCHFTANYVEGEGMRSPGSTSVVWDCVDTRKFCPGRVNPAVLEKYGIPDPAAFVNVLTLGRMTPDVAYKGYERLLEVFARASAAVPNLRLVYAGRGSLVDSLRARARELGTSERVHFAGAIDEPDLPDVYRSAQIFSLVGDRGVGRGEGLPLTAIEAAACGVPILVGNQDGSREAIVESRNGFHLHPFDPSAHLEKIIELARAPELRARLGAGGAEVAKGFFSFEGFHKKHEALLGTWLTRVRP